MTISYNRLGSNGRLGNQMFQYAGLRGIAANRGFDLRWIPAGSQEAACGPGHCGQEPRQCAAHRDRVGEA